MKKGSKHSPESKEKMRRARLGKWRGESNPAWKGGLPSCLDCGKKLSHRGSKRCSKCSPKVVSRDPERNRKISEAMKKVVKTPEWNLNVGNALRGKKFSKERIEKMSGANSPNWKGGIEPERKKIYKSQKYKDWRKSVFERDGYTCQHCKKTNVELNAHHIKPFSIFIEERFNVDNGLTLCVPCHKKHHKSEWLNQYSSGVNYGNTK